MTVLYILVAVGTILSGVAAVGQLYLQAHVRKLRTEVNGQSHVLVETAHKLGISEGALQEIRQPTRHGNGAKA